MWRLRTSGTAARNKRFYFTTGPDAWDTRNGMAWNVRLPQPLLDDFSEMLMNTNEAWYANSNPNGVWSWAFASLLLGEGGGMSSP